MRLSGWLMYWTSSTGKCLGAFFLLFVCFYYEEDVLIALCPHLYSCGGTEGWRSVFSSAMDIDADDQTSVISARSGSVRSNATPGSLRKKVKEKTVANLRPSKPHLSLSSDSVLSVAQLLQRKRGDASLVVHTEGSVAGTSL